MKKCLLVFMLAAALLGVSCKKEEARKVSAPPTVVVAKAVMGNVSSSSEIIGQARAYDEVDLVARVQGFLTKINFKEGSNVKKGQLLFEIEQDEYKALVESADADLLKAQAVFNNAEINYNRQKKLSESDATSKKNLDDATSDYLSAKASLLGAKADLSTANINLGYTSIKAPFDGRIGFFSYSEGNLVSSGSKKLANIVKLDPIRISFHASELDIINFQLARIQTGVARKDQVSVRLQFQNGSFYKYSGAISFADNKINSSTGTMLVEALFENPEEMIVPGMYLKVVLQDKDQTPALLIPLTGIQESQAGKSVLVVGKDKKVSQRLIKTGIKSGPRVQVLSGLEEGEMIIVEGLQKVRLGSLVEYVLDESCSLDKSEALPEKK